MGLKHLSIEEKTKRVKLALEYLSISDELKKLEREVLATSKQLKYLRKKDNKSKESKDCSKLLYIKKRRRDSFLKKYEKISTQLCLGLELSFCLDGEEMELLAHQILSDYKLVYLEVIGGWAKRTFYRIYQKNKRESI
jgi:hypothetical protein